MFKKPRVALAIFFKQAGCPFPNVFRRRIEKVSLVVYPAEYGVSGVMTFVVNQNGSVYEKDLGKNTEAAAKATTNYNPDNA